MSIQGRQRHRVTRRQHQRRSVRPSDTHGGPYRALPPPCRNRSIMLLPQSAQGQGALRCSYSRARPCHHKRAAIGGSGRQERRNEPTYTGTATRFNHCGTSCCAFFRKGMFYCGLLTCGLTTDVFAGLVPCACATAEPPATRRRLVLPARTLQFASTALFDPPRSQTQRADKSRPWKNLQREHIYRL